jgi:hypothetical protein
MEEHCKPEDVVAIPHDWRCAVCTFINNNPNPLCEACGSKYIPQTEQLEFREAPIKEAPVKEEQPKYSPSEALREEVGRMMLARDRRGLAPLTLALFFRGRVRMVVLGPGEAQLRAFYRTAMNSVIDHSTMRAVNHQSELDNSKLTAFPSLHQPWTIV